MFRAKALFIVLEKEEVCQANIKHVCVVAVFLHQVQSLLSAVPSPEEGLGYLPRPAGACVSLNGQNVQLLSAHM